MRTSTAAAMHTTTLRVTVASVFAAAAVWDEHYRTLTMDMFREWVTAFSIPRPYVTTLEALAAVGLHYEDRTTVALDSRPAVKRNTLTAARCVELVRQERGRRNQAELLTPPAPPTETERIEAAASVQLARTIPCPACPAQENDPCMTPSKEPARVDHWQRLRDARKA